MERGYATPLCLHIIPLRGYWQCKTLYTFRHSQRLGLLLNKVAPGPDPAVAVAVASPLRLALRLSESGLIFV